MVCHNPVQNHFCESRDLLASWEMRGAEDMHRKVPAFTGMTIVKKEKWGRLLKDGPKTI
jgi:hypothetical protein